MEDLIRQAFLHVDVIGPHVMEGYYDLLGPNNEIILPSVWESVVEPDWIVTMHIWPLPEPLEPLKPSPDEPASEMPPPEEPYIDVPLPEEPSLKAPLSRPPTSQNSPTSPPASPPATTAATTAAENFLPSEAL